MKPKLSNLLMFVLIIQQMTDIFGRRRSHGRKFTQGKGATIAVAPGDTLVSSLIVSRKTRNIPVHPPYRWYYAVNDNHLLFFTHSKCNNKFLREIRPKLINRKTGKYAEVNFKNRGKKQPHVGAIGSLVAILMANKELPFNLLFCNSKHYVEYLSRGYTRGKWYKLLYNRTSKDCPVFNPLPNDLNSLFQVFFTKSFVLRDKMQKSIELSVSHWPLDIIPLPQLPPSWLRKQ